MKKLTLPKMQEVQRFEDLSGSIAESLLLFNFLRSVREDSRIGPCHISIYLSLLTLYPPVSSKPTAINKKELMLWAKVSRSTFHRAIKHLQFCGYIIYSPSFDPCKSSTIKLTDPTEFINKLK